MQWLGTTFHLPTDASPLLSLFILPLNITWLITYLVVMLVVTNPSPCLPGQLKPATQEAVTWGILGWETVWIRRDRLMIEGILFSKHQVSDHYTATLESAVGGVWGEG